MRPWGSYEGAGAPLVAGGGERYLLGEGPFGATAEAAGGGARLIGHRRCPGAIARIHRCPVATGAVDAARLQP